MDLFDFNNDDIEKPRYIPLAEKMRPSNLDEFYGQKHLLGPGKILRKIIENDTVTSMIIQGPPSSGKTSLAYIISKLSKGHFVSLNSVSLTVSELREVLKIAEENLKFYNTKTIVFIDEIQAMKSNIQMTLLPAVEKGQIIMIGATTENVMHSIIPALLSRCRVYKFERLSNEEMSEIILLALRDANRGLGDNTTRVDSDALEMIISMSDGDIRNALGALESIHLSLYETNIIDLSLVKEVYQRRINAVNTDDEYNLMSAFIKSMRGSQTDAALYWLARMIHSGIDPAYIARRIIVHSVEDVGMASPQALNIAVSAKAAVESLGYPEARLPLAQAVIFICESPKSNSVYKAINAALNYVEHHEKQPVPDNIRQGSKTYVNPIDHPEAQNEYLKDFNSKMHFYQPQNSGIESKILNKKTLE